VILDDGPVALDPPAAVDSIYRPDHNETMVVVPLRPEVQDDELIAAVASLGFASLIFLRTVRRLSFHDLEQSDRDTEFAVDAGIPVQIPLTVGTDVREVEYVALRVLAPAEAVGARYERYWTDLPVQEGQTRLNKATGDTTPLGVCVAADSASRTALYDRVPLPIKLGFPISLNAQFDPDSGRSTVLPDRWNEERFTDLGRLLGSAALYAFGRAPASAWSYVPLKREVGDAEDWVFRKIADLVVEDCHRRLLAELRLPTSSEREPLSRIVYEEKALESVLSPTDQELLAEGHFALQPEHRDASGRWREVLAELGESHLLTITDALRIFDHPEHLPGRDPSWFVEIAALAVEAGLFLEFVAKAGILLADGRVVSCPEKGGPRVLVRDAEENSLALRLGLALRLHPAYRTNTARANAVLAKLTAAGVLFGSYDAPADALNLLARHGAGAVVMQDSHIRLSDADLIDVRDAWVRLPREQQRLLGISVGANIELRAIRHEPSGKAVSVWAHPSDAYLPARIDRETESFAKAANRTPGLVWIDPTYGKLLKHERGRSEAGAQRLLAAWGVARDPRLIKPLNEHAYWTRDTRPASSIIDVDRPATQLRAIKASGPASYLLDDHWSPDLDAVLADIQKSPAKTRRKRALALLAVLSRAWDRRYAESQTAKAVSAYNGYWNSPREVQATWLARLATAAWLPNGNNVLTAPIDLALPTQANLITRGGTRGAFLTKVDTQILRSGILQALGVQTGPSAADLIKRLLLLRERPVTSKLTAEVHTIYQLLAATTQNPSADAMSGRAITPQQLRNAFRATATGLGLLLATGSWHTPESVLRGPPIFGRFRTFAPHISGLDTLWATLQIPEPAPSDCVSVLRELAREPLSGETQGIMLTTFRTLALKIKTASPQLRAGLRRLPLWSGTGWSVERPAYALEGLTLAEVSPRGLAVWRPGLTSFVEVESLLSPLGVVLLRLEDFSPQYLTAADVVDGDAHRHRFAEAVVLLKDELARGDIALHDALGPSWAELQRARFILDPDLEIKVTLGRGRDIVLPARAHMMREPLTLVARSLSDAEAPGGGGQAIASLFSGDRQKVAWAWGAMWRRVGTGEQVARIELPSTQAEAANGVDRLTSLQEQSKDRSAKRTRPPFVSAPTLPTKAAPTIQVRQLRSIDELEPTGGTIVNKGANCQGMVFVKTHAGGQHERSFIRPNPQGPSGPPHQSRSVLPPTSDREILALEAVKRALRLDASQIRDLRDRRNFGVDAIDELRQCYEFKMSSGAAVPTDVTLTASEVEAAQNDPDFFLAVVSGLEAGEGVLRVRFIFKPLEQLAAKIKGELTLTGVDRAEALEYEFEAASDTNS
jgi:hypothetical protein